MISCRRSAGWVWRWRCPPWHSHRGRAHRAASGSPISRTGPWPAAASAFCSWRLIRRATTPARGRWCGQAVALVLVVAAALPALSKLRGSGDRLQIGVVARCGAAAGSLGAGANLMFLLASAGGQLAIVAVLAGLYPAVTVILAAVVLGERPRALQVVGLVAAAMSVVLIVAG